MKNTSSEAPNCHKSRGSDASAANLLLVLRRQLNL